MIKVSIIDMKVFKSQIENDSIFLACEDSSGNVYQPKIQVQNDAEYKTMLGRLKINVAEKVMLNNNITTADMVYMTLSRRIANRLK